MRAADGFEVFKKVPGGRWQQVAIAPTLERVARLARELIEAGCPAGFKRQGESLIKPVITEY